MIILHPHQSKMRADIMAELRRRVRRVLLQSATGSGKTVVAADLARGAAAKGKSLFFVVHRKELVHQSVAAFNAMGVDSGVIAAGFSPRQSLIQIAMVGSLARRTHLFPEPTVLVIDEAHHAVAGTWKKLMSAYPSAIVIGLTATPQRLDGKSLGERFDRLICGPTVDWLINNQFLAPFRAFSPPAVAYLSDLRSRAGDFKREEIQSIMDRPTITGDAIDHYKRLAGGMMMIVFCAGIEHSKNVAEAYRAAGVAAAHCDGKTPAAERDEIMGRFRSGEITVISNVGLISEGFDVPAAGAVQILRPTMSLGLHLQMLGRVLRYEQGKTAIILDHVGNIARHGLPDQHREWCLECRGPKEDDEVNAKQCPDCDEWCRKDALLCPCGFEFLVKKLGDPVKKLGGIVEVPGELVEHVKNPQIDFEKLSRWQQLNAAQTIEDFRAIAKIRGYKRGWATHAFKEKEAGEQFLRIKLNSDYGVENGTQT